MRKRIAFAIAVLMVVFGGLVVSVKGNGWPCDASPPPGCFVVEECTLIGEEISCHCALECPGGTSTPGPTATPGGPTPTPAPTPTPDPNAICVGYCLDSPFYLSMCGGPAVMVDFYYLCNDPLGGVVDVICYDEIPPHCGPPPTPEPGGPYPPQLTELYVGVLCPHPTLSRSPYPRGMVTVENELWIAGSPTAEDHSAPVLWGAKHDYTVYLKWKRIPGYASWDPNDGTPPKLGDRVRHTYYKSSWGKPENGPGLGGRTDLPAFQVTATTWWKALWRETWWEWEQRQRPRWRCGQVAECGTETLNCFKDADNFGCETWCGWADEVNQVPNNNAKCWTETYNVRVDHDTGWSVVDLRPLGNPTWYYSQHTGLPIPVIEIQGVITAP